mmetsp:Transcript_14472/g.22844  ORF Transcript_14472/g.22844 Transcript_14472/m.22844 type:complete len:680 (+) Transcript_14472:235-2274(+)
MASIKRLILTLVALTLLGTASARNSTKVNGAARELTPGGVFELSSARRTGDSKCSSPYPYGQPGCRDAVNGTIEAVDELTKQLGFENSWLADVLLPLLNAAKTQIAKLGGGWEFANSNFCFGQFSGKSILSAPTQGPESQLGADKCIRIPVNPDSEYTVFSLSLPSFVMKPICADLDPKFTAVSFCLVISLCESNLPTIAFALDKGAFNCILGNPATTAATGGASKLVAEASKLTLESLAWGLSPTADLEKTLTLYNGQDEVQVTAKANFAQTVDLSVGSGSIKLPDYLKITTTGYQLLSVVGNVVDLVEELGESKTDISSLLETITDGFSSAITGTVDLTYKLNEISKGAFPDIKMNLATGSAFISAQSKDVSGVERGMYVYAAARNFVGVAVEAIMKTFLPLLRNVIDKLFGDGASDNLMKSLKPDSSNDNRFGMTVNEKVSAFSLSITMDGALQSLPPFSLLPTPSGWAGDLKVQCRFHYEDSDLSCSVDYKVPKFFTMVVEKGLHVIREAKDFFDRTGNIIAAVAEDVIDDISDCAIGFFTNEGDHCVVFSDKNIQKTAQEIAEFGEDVGEQIIEWAKAAESWCGTQWVVDAVVCGTEVVTDGAKCGFHSVKDYAICGGKMVTDGAVCGWDWITAGWDCIVHGKCKSPKTCQIANTCSVPNECKITLECQVPKPC